MIAIREDFLARKIEITEYVDLLIKFENGEYRISHQGNLISFPLATRTTQRSCAFLLLYNIVEAIVTKLLVKIHDILILENVSYFDLNDDIKDLTLIYFNSIVNKKQNFPDAAPFLQKFVGMLFGNLHFHVPYKEMEKHYSLYSGNLDSKKIRETFSKYGLSVEVVASELKTIKDGRNKLAHGEVSFEEFGREISVQQIKILTTATLTYLESLINSIENFINECGYKVANPAQVSELA